MFLRKIVVILVPLLLLALVCLLTPLLTSLHPFLGHLLLGALLGTALALLLPLSGATRQHEPFAHLLWIPSLLTLLVLLYQYLSSIGIRTDALEFLAVTDTRIITLETAFAAYMLTFLIRAGRGIRNAPRR